MEEYTFRGNAISSTYTLNFRQDEFSTKVDRFLEKIEKVDPEEMRGREIDRLFRLSCIHK